MNFPFSKLINYRNCSSRDSSAHQDKSAIDPASQVDDTERCGKTELIQPRLKFQNKNSHKNSDDSLRTRLDSSGSENDKQNSMSPRLERPLPTKTTYYPWNLNSLFTQINYLNRTHMQNSLNINNCTSLQKRFVDLLKHSVTPEPVKLKATKIYDKFNIDDLDGLRLDTLNMEDKECKDNDKNDNLAIPLDLTVRMSLLLNMQK